MLLVNPTISNGKWAENGLKLRVSRPFSFHSWIKQYYVSEWTEVYSISHLKYNGENCTNGVSKQQKYGAKYIDNQCMVE